MSPQVEFMKYVVLSVMFLSTTAMSVFALVFFPKIASRLNRNLPDRPSRAAKLFLPPGGRFDSQENLLYVRMSGFVGTLMAAFCAVVLVWWAAEAVGAAIGARR